MEEKTKKTIKRIISCCAGIIACIVLVVGGYYMGWSSRESAAQEEKAAMEKQSETIAVVNMDAGVAVNDENINYATKLMSSLSEEYVLTNLQEAQNGINQNKYAAYLVIPSNFSESVVSLNTTPQKARIEYAINSKLSSDDSVKTLKNVETFNQMLNSGMSYMYISSILGEVHSVQDGAATIMDNDQEDTEVILAITPYDLTSMLKLPDLSHVDNSVEPLNVESYTEQNTKDVDSIGERYTYYISLSEADWKTLSEEGNQLTADWTLMEEKINDVDVTKDEEGVNVIEAGLKTTKEKLEEYSTTLDTKESEIQTYLETIKQDIDSRNKELGTAITMYNKNRELNLTSTAQNISETLQTVINVPITGVDDTIIVADTSIDIPYNQNPELTVSRGAVFQNYMNTVNELILKSNDTNLLLAYEEYVDSDPTGALEQMETTMSDFISLTKEDAMIQAGIDSKTLADGISTEVNSQITENLPTAQKIQEILNSSIPTFEDVLNKGTAEETTIREQLQKTSDEIGIDLQNGTTKTIPRLPAEEFETQINTGIITPLTANTDRVKSELVEQYQTEKTTLNTYMTTLDSYDPLGYIDQNEIQGIVGNMKQTGSKLQADISEDYSSNMKYVSEVTANAEKNVSSLTESVTQSDEASKKAVTEGLTTAQGAKARTLETNKALLLEFTKKLPYTRLGNLEYTNAYQFISDPTQLIAKTEVDIEKEQESKAAIKEAKRGAKETMIILLILFGIVILVVLMKNLLGGRRVKARKDQMTYIS
ncbi:MAG: hypothetical protein PHX08_09185 [Lachnospiraceae bacterium]|nr:hypothetical protein [Lachnospiraceae bacterium]